MPIPPIAALLLAFSIIVTTCDALSSSSTVVRSSRMISLSYSIDGNDDGPRSLRVRIGSRRKFILEDAVKRKQPTSDSSSSSLYNAIIIPSSRVVPRRAISQSNMSPAEAARRAGYVIRQGDTAANEPANDLKDLRQRLTVRGVRRVRIRPIRTLRNLVHRNSHRTQQREEQNLIRIEAINSNKSADAYQRARTREKRAMQLDEHLNNTVEQDNNNLRSGGARRVTFKATREATKSLISKPMASLTEYMTQPVSQYSLLSFHDAEIVGSGNEKNPKQRRWHVRRLTNDEAKRYTSSEDSEVMDTTNLFRLAVPLLPLIGWDLTPVIDLEVVQMKRYSSLADLITRTRKNEETYVIYESLDTTDASSNWAPLRGIRKRMSRRGGHDTNDDGVNNVQLSSPVVKIRSLSVSLLSTQKEVNEVMSNKSRNDGRKMNEQRRGNSKNSMQREAIDMVNKVEEWLRPHITFEAELSWNDNTSNSSSVVEIDSTTTSSTVTVKSTAITSLTIPEIQSDIIRKRVPSGFLVKRLGATLTSRALAICLPRFLNQLDKDYNRWSA